MSALNVSTSVSHGSVPLFIDFRNTSSSDAILPRFLLQVMIILTLTRLFGKLLSYCRQPPVIGEMIAGIFVGPSVLGYVSGWTSTFYPAASVSYFALVANVGLILFMFYMGLELDQQLLRKQWRYSVPIAVSAIIFPFGVGALISLWLYELNNEFFPQPVDRLAFTLFSGSSMSFTAFPVLASILTATGLVTAPIGVQALSCAAIDDILAWTLLAISSSFAKQGDARAGAYTFLLASSFVLVWIFIIRRVLAMIHKHYLKNNDETNKSFVVLIIFQLLAASFICEEIGVHSFFGAFVAGLIVPKTGNIIPFLAPKIELITVEFFLPLYFANSGIKTQIGTLSDGSSWGAVIAVILIATFAKFTPACLVSKLVTRRDWRFCVTLGVLMNTRGLVELIALNVGLEAHILSPRLFTILVIMAIVTTFMTSPSMWFLYQRSYNPELEQEPTRAIEDVKHTPDAVLDHMDADEPVLFTGDRNELPRTNSPYRLYVDTSQRNSNDQSRSFNQPLPVQPSSAVTNDALENLSLASSNSNDLRQRTERNNSVSELRSIDSDKKTVTAATGSSLMESPLKPSLTRLKSKLSQGSSDLTTDSEGEVAANQMVNSSRIIELSYQSPSVRSQLQRENSARIRSPKHLPSNTNTRPTDNT